MRQLISSCFRRVIYGCLRQWRFILKASNLGVFSAPHEGIVRDEGIAPKKKKTDVGLLLGFSDRNGWNGVSANQMARTGAGDQVYRGE